ncbi:MAG: hypothetical protein ACREAC_09505 [Blastocatellia bacterium]
MKSMNVLNKTWKVGDKREVTEDQMKGLIDLDLYDSYDQTYLIDRLKWKVRHRVVSSDASTAYTMEAIEEE